MYIVKPYESALSLFGADGSVRVFKTMQAALKALGFNWIARNVGRHFHQWDYDIQVRRRNGAPYLKRRVFRDAAFVMRNDVGAVVTANDFVPLKTGDCWKPRTWRGHLPRNWAYSRWNGYGSVPCISKPTASKYYGRYYYRHLRNAKNLLVTAECFIEEGEPGPRTARSRPHLPNTRDGRDVLARSNHNWKQFRRRQWKR